jgi:hypothetical protein
MPPPTHIVTTPYFECAACLDQDVAGKSRPCTGQDWYDGPRALEACKQVDDRNIALDDALICLTVRIPAGLNFRERQGRRNRARSFASKMHLLHRQRYVLFGGVRTGF